MFADLKNLNDHLSPRFLSRLDHLEIMMTVKVKKYILKIPIIYLSARTVIGQFRGPYSSVRPAKIYSFFVAKIFLDLSPLGSSLKASISLNFLILLEWCIKPC